MAIQLYSVVNFNGCLFRVVAVSVDGVRGNSRHRRPRAVLYGRFPESVLVLSTQLENGVELGTEVLRRQRRKSCQH